jgi:hypothetical protein
MKIANPKTKDKQTKMTETAKTPELQLRRMVVVRGVKIRSPSFLFISIEQYSKPKNTKYLILCN